MCGLDGRHSTTVVPQLHRKSELENIRRATLDHGCLEHCRTPTAAGLGFGSELAAAAVSSEFLAAVMSMSIDELIASRLLARVSVIRSETS